VAEILGCNSPLTLGTSSGGGKPTTQLHLINLRRPNPAAQKVVASTYSS
jgi:hypothetical protein